MDSGYGPGYAQTDAVAGDGNIMKGASCMSDPAKPGVQNCFITCCPPGGFGAAGLPSGMAAMAPGALRQALGSLACPTCGGGNCLFGIGCMIRSALAGASKSACCSDCASGGSPCKSASYPPQVTYAPRDLAAGNYLSWFR